MPYTYLDDVVLPRDPTNPLQATTKGYSDTKLRWVPYTTAGQSFLKNDVTRDGDWTMIANKDTTQKPSPTDTGPTEDLLGQWAPTNLAAKAAYTVRNTWTMSTAGRINTYGIVVVQGNLGFRHVVTLLVNGVIKERLDVEPNEAGTIWRSMTPVLVVAGTVVAVELSVTEMIQGVQDVYWQQHSAWFATLPQYTSAATGQKDGGAPTTTAYGCHVQFTPGTMPTDWDVMAFSGGTAGSGGSGGGGGVPAHEHDAAYVNIEGDTLTGPLILSRDPQSSMEAVTRNYVDTRTASPAGPATGDLSGTYPSPQIAAGVIVDADVNASANIAQSKVAGLPAALTSKAAAATTVTAGNGLTGGGDLTANRTLDVGAGTGIVVAADTVSLDTAYADGRYINTSGDSMTGPLLLAGDPTDPLGAATRQYIDNKTVPPEVYAQTTEPASTVVAMWADTTDPKEPGSGGGAGGELATRAYVDEVVTVSDAAPTLPPSRDGLLWVVV